MKKLITEDGDATDYYIEIIESIFKRFDTDKDGYLNMDEFNGMLKISNEELATEESFEILSCSSIMTWTREGMKKTRRRQKRSFNRK